MEIKGASLPTPKISSNPEWLIHVTTVYILSYNYTINNMINKVVWYKCPVIRENSVHQGKGMMEVEGDKQGKASEKMQRTVGWSLQERRDLI